MLTDDGYEDIEDIGQGDYVLAENPKTGEQEYKELAHTFIRETDTIVHVHIRDADGNIRIRIDPPDEITNYPHVHAYDSDGNLLDSAGNIVDRKSPDGHIPYKDN